MRDLAAKESESLAASSSSVWRMIRRLKKERIKTSKAVRKRVFLV